MLQQMTSDERLLQQMTADEHLAVRIWPELDERPTTWHPNPFKTAAESFHDLLLIAESEERKADLTLLRNIATYRAANP